MINLFLRIMPLLMAAAVSAVVLAGATVSGAYYYFKPALPSADTLREVKLQTPLRIYSRDGKLMGQTGEKRRTPVGFDDIPRVVVDAFLAAEDDRFFEHPGFDYQGIIRAAANLALTGSRSQGGSTITQQLARVYFLTRERTFVRKAKELILAMQIEAEFSKEEILSLYLNKIFLGQRAYGVGAAAEVYFGKRLANLTVAEAATIAGIPKAPSVLNPVSNVGRATERRAYVLRRMLELELIDRQAYDEAVATPVMSRLHGPRVELKAPYVTEMVRAEMIRRYGPEAYTAGYRVATTIDSRLQEAADDALRIALLEYDRRHGYRGPLETGMLEGMDRAAAGNELRLELQQRLETFPSFDYLHVAVALATGEDNSADFFVRDLGVVRVPWENLKWRPYIDDNNVGAAPKGAEDMVMPGDVVYLLRAADRGWMLAQIPEVQGAFVALDPLDGATLALCGGFEFYLSKFNRAVQSRRQPGSSFKPFIYSAALDNGFTTATLVNDAPVVFDDANLEDTWRPENYSRRFHGPVRLREALVRSLNLVSVRVLLGTGIGAALEHIRPFGLPESALPRDSSLALGSGGAAPLDLAAGYAVFANGGHRTDHYLLERVFDAAGAVVFEASPKFVCRQCAGEAAGDDRTEPGTGPAWLAGSDGTADSSGAGAPATKLPAIIDATAEDPDEVPPYDDVAAMSRHGLTWHPEPEEAPRFYDRLTKPAERVISAENAYLVYDMMRDVIRRGTGRRARDLGRDDLAGKTGTSNDRRDAWFSGYNGAIVATAWVGFDEARSLGAGEEGSRTALPMWKYFMAEALRNAPDATIQRPPGIITARIVPESGLIAPAGYGDAVFELFREGRVPALQAEESGSLTPGSRLDEDDPADEMIF